MGGGSHREGVDPFAGPQATQSGIASLVPGWLREDIKIRRHVGMSVGRWGRKDLESRVLVVEHEILGRGFDVIGGSEIVFRVGTGNSRRVVEMLERPEFPDDGYLDTEFLVSDAMDGLPARFVLEDCGPGHEPRVLRGLVPAFPEHDPIAGFDNEVDGDDRNACDDSTLVGIRNPTEVDHQESR